MSSDNNFHLRFNDFESNIRNCWQGFQAENEFYDAILACEDKQVKTHKIIISYFSPILRNILKFSENPHPLIYLTRVKFRYLQNLLNFMYQGEVSIAEEDLPNFLEVAEDLQIKGLSKSDDGNIDDVNIVSPSKRIISEEHSSEISLKDSLAGTDAKIINKNTKPEKSEELKNCSISFNGGCNSENENSFEDDLNNGLFLKENSNKGNMSEVHFEESLVDTSANNENFEFTDVKSHNETVNYEKSKEQKQSLVSYDGRKPFVCEQCDKEFPYKSVLVSHVKYTHEGERHNCGQCNYKAKRHDHLTKHIESIHMGVKYQCNQCDYRASQVGHLKIHTESIHEGVRYPCKQCNYRATEKGHLKKHIRAAHTTERYLCNHCDYKAALMGTLKNHVLRKHT